MAKKRKSAGLHAGQAHLSRKQKKREQRAAQTSSQAPALATPPRPAQTAYLRALEAGAKKAKKKKVLERRRLREARNVREARHERFSEWFLLAWCYIAPLAGMLASAVVYVVVEISFGETAALVGASLAIVGIYGYDVFRARGE